jgi:hypothetical protein
MSLKTSAGGLKDCDDEVSVVLENLKFGINVCVFRSFMETGIESFLGVRIGPHFLFLG